MSLSEIVSRHDFSIKFFWFLFTFMVLWHARNVVAHVLILSRTGRWRHFDKMLSTFLLFTYLLWEIFYAFSCRPFCSSITSNFFNIDLWITNWKIEVLKTSVWSFSHSTLEPSLFVWKYISFWDDFHWDKFSFNLQVLFLRVRDPYKLLPFLRGGVGGFLYLFNTKPSESLFSSESHYLLQEG